jgi:CRISPR-associated protein Csx10
MKFISYQIELQQPVLVTDLEGEPNSSVSLNFLPGSVLRGAIINKFFQARKPQTRQSEIDAADDEMQRLFFNGATRYLNAYPVEDSQRTLPTPSSWHGKKGDESLDITRRRVYDFAVAYPEEEYGEGTDIKWQPKREPFCTLSGKEIRLLRPERRLAVHTARNRKYGRPLNPERIAEMIKNNKLDKEDEAGTIYRYEALAAEQRFEAVIICEHDDDVLRLLPLLSGTARIGRSKLAGYGQIRFEPAKQLDTWREISGELMTDGNRLIITLLSDALIRNGNGQFVVDPEAVTDTIGKKLGCKVELSEAFLHGHEVGGFNRKWGMPMTQALAVRMGSVFVFKNPNCDPSKLRDLEMSGIGERRVDGFGRIAINWNVFEDELHFAPDSKNGLYRSLSIPANTPAEKLARNMAGKMVERMLRQRIDDRLVALANDLEIKNPPKRSQLSRLRNIIQDELLKDDPKAARLENVIKSLRDRITARRQFENARIGGQPMLNWLEDTYKKADANSWKDLLVIKTADLRNIGDIAPEIDQNDKLRNEYLLRYIDAVLARAAKLKKETEKER